MENLNRQVTEKEIKTVAEKIDDMAGANLRATIKALHKAQRGSYFVTIKEDAEFNEITVKLYESTRGGAIATGYIDRGHTAESRYEAAEELRGLVRAYLCR